MLTLCAGVYSQTRQGGTGGSALHLTDITLRMTLLLSYTASDVTCEGQGPMKDKKDFPPTNTQVRVSLNSEGQHRAVPPV